MILKQQKEILSIIEKIGLKVHFLNPESEKQMYVQKQKWDIFDRIHISSSPKITFLTYYFNILGSSGKLTEIFREEIPADCENKEEIILNFIKKTEEFIKQRKKIQKIINKYWDENAR